MHHIRVGHLALVVSVALIYGHQYASGSWPLDGCLFRENATAGVCRQLNDCPGAIDELRSPQRLKPTKCGFDGKMPIVCCRLAPVPNASAPQRRSSERACNEFRKYLPHRSAARRRRHVGSGGGAVGGTVTTPGEFPHMVALGWRPANQSTIVWRCGGTLISDRFVLTAAHCVHGSAPDAVRIGVHELRSAADDRADSGQRTIAEIVVHPEYASPAGYNDIALIRLVTPVQLSAGQLPACLWQADSDPQSPLLATGFGRIEYGGQLSSDLIKVQLTVVPRPACDRLYGKERKLPHGLDDSQLCAGDPSGRQDTCEGDSGGPLGLLAERQHRVVGITSFGRGCANQTPGVYTRVSAFVAWIELHVWP